MSSGEGVILLGHFLGKPVINYPDIRTKVVFLTWLFHLGVKFSTLKIWCNWMNLLLNLLLLFPLKVLLKLLREKLELPKRCNTVRNKTLTFRNRNGYLKWKCLSYQRFPNGLYNQWDYYIVSQNLKLPICHLPGNALMWIYLPKKRNRLSLKKIKRFPVDFRMTIRNFEWQEPFKEYPTCQYLNRRQSKMMHR